MTLSPSDSRQVGTFLDMTAPTVSGWASFIGFMGVVAAPRFTKDQTRDPVGTLMDRAASAKLCSWKVGPQTPPEMAAKEYLSMPPFHKGAHWPKLVVCTALDAITGSPPQRQP